MFCLLFQKLKTLTKRGDSIVIESHAQTHNHRMIHMNIKLFIVGLIWGSCFFMVAEVSAGNVKIGKNPENCKKINKYGSRVDVMIAEKFKVPVSSVRFLGAKWQLFSDKRTEFDFGSPREDCVLTFDTAKGPVECKEGRAFLFTDDGGVTAWTPIINTEFEDVISTCQK